MNTISHIGSQAQNIMSCLYLQKCILLFINHYRNQVTSDFKFTWQWKWTDIAWRSMDNIENSDDGQT